MKGPKEWRSLWVDAAAAALPALEPSMRHSNPSAPEIAKRAAQVADAVMAELAEREKTLR